MKNPTGGIFYLPHPLWHENTGTYWLCKHGRDSKRKGCPWCAIQHPVLAFRWHHKKEMCKHVLFPDDPVCLRCDIDIEKDVQA
jgi:hypothetical protein